MNTTPFSLPFLFRPFLLLALLSSVAAGADAPPYVRLASGVSGHVHPAACVTKKGTILVIFGQQEYIDLRITRSSDGGRTWSEPAKYGPTQKVNIYPGSLTTLADGRILHIWNVWYADKEAQGGKTRFAQFSLSDDDGRTWSEPKNLAKPKTPEPHSVNRHPVVELGPSEWLVPLMDRTIVYDTKTGEEKPFGGGRNHGLVPIVKTAKGTLISGLGLRSTDDGKSWQTVSPFPKIDKDGWRYDLRALDNGWLIAAEVIGPGVGGDKWRFVVSKDDGQSWDFNSAEDFYNPGRPIGGRACPKTVHLDGETVGTVFYDVDEKQPGGSGVFFLRTPMSKL